MAKVYWIDKDAIAVGDIDAQGNVTGPTAGTLSLHCSRHDAPFVGVDIGVNNSAGVRIEIGMLQSPVLPVEYHEALTYKAIAHGYEKKGELKTADYFHQKFNVSINEGKQESNSAKSEESPISIIPRDY